MEEYLPAGQPTHRGAVASLYFPATHDVQVVLHGVHGLLLDVLHVEVEGLQETHTDAPVIDPVPDGQV